MSSREMQRIARRFGVGYVTVWCVWDTSINETYYKSRRKATRAAKRIAKRHGLPWDVFADVLLQGDIYRADSAQVLGAI